MKISRPISICLVVTFMVAPALVCASPSGKPDQLAALSVSSQSPAGAEEEPVETIADPLEPVNRIFFGFNDKLYFWVLKPVATGYKTVFPEPVRVGVKNFFSNLTTPIRLVNCLLQGNFKGAGNETIRLALNSTLGLAGFLDPAKKELKIEKQEEDFGQTGNLGMGPLFYIEWPLLGGSSLRDTVGYAGDLALDPQTYLITSFPVNLAIRSYEEINDHSLKIGEYEDLKEAAIDPYVAKRDAYHQYRQHKIREKGRTAELTGSSREPRRSRAAHVAHLDLVMDNNNLCGY